MDAGRKHDTVGEAQMTLSVTAVSVARYQHFLEQVPQVPVLTGRG